jgi:hypothetical protein
VSPQARSSDRLRLLSILARGVTVPYNKVLNVDRPIYESMPSIDHRWDAGLGERDGPKQARLGRASGARRVVRSGGVV